MMQNPAATKQFKKPVNLSLLQKLPQPAAVHTYDEEDEDWAAFIAKGYGNFPLPPEHVSPASTIMSSSTFLSPSTCATSLPSSDRSKGGEAWPDDESAWASEDEDGVTNVALGSRIDEEQEIVKSPTMPVSESSLSKKNSGNGDDFYTPKTSPERRTHPALKPQGKASPTTTCLAGEPSSFDRKVPSIQVSDEDPLILSSTHIQRSRSTAKLVRLLGEESICPRPRRTSQASSSISSVDNDSTYSSLAYLSADTKGQSTASKLCHRLASKMNLSHSSRNSTPDVPVTPRSASSDVVLCTQDDKNLSPSCAIFGSAAINARASAYAAMAASMLSSDHDSVRSSTGSLQMSEGRSSHPIGKSAIPKAGFCFDYDPRSPLFLSLADDGC